MVSQHKHLSVTFIDFTAWSHSINICQWPSLISLLVCVLTELMDCLFISAGLCADRASGLPVWLYLLVCVLTELVDCDKLDEGCNGGLPYNAYEAIMKLGEWCQPWPCFDLEHVGWMCSHVTEVQQLDLNTSVYVSSPIVCLWVCLSELPLHVCVHVCVSVFLLCVSVPVCL